MELITADWQAPSHIRAVTTIRQGGASEGAFNSFNLGDHVGDSPAAVAQNRRQLMDELGLQKPAQWLTQVHGVEVVEAQADGQIRQADACWTDQPGLACVIMTADCLPVFFTDTAGKQVALAHAGWRGLAEGVLESTLARFADPQEVLVWLGPAIGPEAFEVGAEVRQQFMARLPESEAAFEPATESGKYLADIYRLAELRLRSAGVEQISHCGLCTYTDKARFYSYRRDGQTGRLASLIWIDKP
ncbi:peptidoglycan editing factor PgeF [Neptuniibacter halophilus]|uniref:peptidoglycan editing factor PgeF n=1 Tax=Neptuniibacter halophilus TaxID=651666 RepID=UPI0025738949|nr:peptidoglycan editing factor PgeF [Neptuniibacter halophilus]